MKLLFDQNLSPRIAGVLQGDFEGSIHVRDIHLERASDEEIWLYARDGGYAVVSKDADFHQRSLVFGHPPKVVWIRRGNCSTDHAIQLILHHSEQIQAFFVDPDAAFLAIR